MKNWKEIAKINNKNLFHLLISAEGEVLENLEKGFPQYFSEEPTTKLTRTEVLKIVEPLSKRDIESFCNVNDLPYKSFYFSGSCKGNTEGFPYTEGGYSTVANGYGQYFYRSTKARGETVSYENTTWLVLWNNSWRGDAYSFSGHSLVLIPLASVLPDF